MTRRANTNADLTFIQSFVLGRLRDHGPMTSADFREARRGEMSGAAEWAMSQLRALERKGFATSHKASWRTYFEITPAGLAEIADLPLTPARTAAMPDDEGKSVCLASARRWNSGLAPDKLNIRSVVNGMGIIEPLDEAEMAEAHRILAILIKELSPSLDEQILPDTVGLRLCKISGADNLRITETVVFEGGRPAVITTLNRAAISGHVGGGIGPQSTFWADQMDANGDHVGEIRLDRESWNALKNRWMRCRMLEDT